MSEKLQNAYKCISDERNDLFKLLFEELKKCKCTQIGVEKDWWKNITDEPGVYVIYESTHIVYCGETDSLKRRMKDLGRTLNHTWRRKIGRDFFSEHSEYQPASSKKKFHNDIEQLLNEHVKQYCVRILPIPLGRAEFERWIIREKSPCFNGRIQRIKS